MALAIFQALESSPGLPALDLDILKHLDATKWLFVSIDLDLDYECSENDRDLVADRSAVNCSGSGAAGNGQHQWGQSGPCAFLGHSSLLIVI
jgi:hypothetical protein